VEMRTRLPRPGDHAGGFELLSARQLEEFGAASLHWRHLNTGCEVLHLHNEDPENLFALAFRTPPADDAGVAHILEHSVLCGSRLFPVKDPFVVLLKTSLNTFLNAFTFPDKTVYPASSMVEKDFFNLLLVYGDAVFFPRLTEEVFMQEAHHLETQGQDGGLKRVGVVFNEMKGVFSSAESIVADASLRSLFPEGPYGFESGGDPKAIPRLTHRDLVDFHRRFYHPANCRIFLYGNVPTPRTLEFLEENFLASFAAASVVSGVDLQPRWREPRRIERTFPVQDGARLEKLTTVTVNWLTVPAADPLLLLAFEVLTELLVGNAGSPLHKALLESRLGADLSPTTGLDTELREAVFSAGLRGTEPERVSAVEEVVLDTLRTLVERGAPEELVRAAAHRVEFRNREIQRGGRPYSLTLMRRCLRGWLHGSDPETTLEFRRWMDSLKERLDQGGYLERLIDEHLLGNPHRTTVVVRPDADQGHREAAAETAELAEIAARLSQAERRGLEEGLARLQRFQEQPDQADALQRIPSLRLSDLNTEVERLPSERVFRELGYPVLFHDIFTNGIAYVDLLLDTTGIENGLVDHIPLLGRAICGCGLPGRPYHEVAGRLGLLTGGLGAALGADTPSPPHSGVAQGLIFRVKMLEENLEAALELVGELLLRADFRDLHRLEALLLETRNDHKASLVPGGSHYAALRAGSRLSPALGLEERWKGVRQYLHLVGLSGGEAGQPKSSLSDLAAALEELRAGLLGRDRLTVNLTCTRGVLPRVAEAVSRLAGNLPERSASGWGGGSASGAVSPDLRLSLAAASPLHGRGGTPGASGSGGPSPDLRLSLEALVGSMDVSFVAQALPASRFGSRENAHEAVLAHYLNTGFLWEQIRMKGGAYGAGASVNGLEAVFTLSSYRDPNIPGTLEAFQGALAHARDTEMSPREFEKVVLGAAGREEKPMAPGEKGYVSLKRELLGITDDMRQTRREQLIACELRDLRAAAERLLGALAGGSAVVLTHRRALEAAAAKLGSLGTSVVELPE
jgi:Zn-dependent M16 (insulinase) family peptidase